MAQIRPTIGCPSNLDMQLNSALQGHLLDRLRAETSGVKHHIHLNNAGASLQVDRVIDAQIAFLRAEALHGGYETVQSQAQELQRPYKALASMLNCQPHNIAIVQSATSAWTQAFFGIPFQEGDRILTSVAEYASNYINFLQAAKRYKTVIEVIPDDSEGEIDLEALESLLTCGNRKPALIAISHIPTSSGRVYDAAAVGSLAKKYGVPYLLDACQSAGQMPLDVNELQCDWLSATARKYLRGPRGMGFLYASDKAMEMYEPAILDLHGAEWTSAKEYRMYPGAVRYEQYEKSFAAQVGFGLAVEYALDLGLDWIWERTQHLAQLLRKRLRRIPGVCVHDVGRTLCGIVTFTIAGSSPQEVKDKMAEQGINVHTSGKSSTRTDFERNELPEAVIRASVSYYNSEEELEVFLKALKAL